MRTSDKMPTAGRLVAAIILAGLCWHVTGLIIEAWPFEKNFGHFQKVSAAVGLVMGWRTIGSRLGRGFLPAISTGLTGFGACLFWIFLLRSFSEMIDLSLRRRYDGVFEALQGMFGIAWEYAQNAAHMPIMLTAVLGCIGLTFVAEMFSRRKG